MPKRNDESGLDAASRFNKRVLRKLEIALRRRPDLDITSALPARYQSTLASKKGCTPMPVPGIDCEPSDGAPSPLPDRPHSPQWTLDTSSPASIVFELSDHVRSLLSEANPLWPESGHALSLAMSGIFKTATSLFQSTAECHHFVARCGEHLAVKAISNPDSTEYSTLRFLETRLPQIPTPKAHGVVAIGGVWYMFMDLVPGVDLATIWTSLTECQKESLRLELDTLLLQLREIPFEHGNVLGGLAGEGCKDTRRRTRTADFPIYTVEELWNFMYGCARNKDTVYGRFLREQTFPPRQQKIVLTHGDFRPANIMVHREEDGGVRVTGLIDWEMSGFYPEDLECIKALNNLSSIGNDDWYLYLPESISPKSRLQSWHADLVWDAYIS